MLWCSQSSMSGMQCGAESGLAYRSSGPLCIDHLPPCSWATSRGLLAILQAFLAYLLHRIFIMASPLYHASLNSAMVHPSYLPSPLAHQSLPVTSRFSSVSSFHRVPLPSLHLICQLSLIRTPVHSEYHLLRFLFYPLLSEYIIS